MLVNYEATNSSITNFFKDNKADFYIVPGFVAKNDLGVPSTLGRGGSDFTASIIAGALNLEKVFIYTDVNGMFTANPNLVPQAYSLKNISYEEAMELSHFGAKVLYPPTYSQFWTKILRSISKTLLSQITREL